MNTILKQAGLIMACALPLAFCSCSSDNDENPVERIEKQNSQIQLITSQYLNEVVYPTYTSLANECDRLYALISGLKQKLKNDSTVTQAEVDAVCTSYLEARRYWEESEAFLYGAASDFEIDPHIDTWPLDVATLAKDLKDEAKIAALDAAESNGEARRYLTKENLGFHGIEFIFFRDGKNRSAAIFNNDEVESFENYFTGLDVSGQEEVIFAAAVACDLRDKCYQLEVAWLGSKAAAAHVARVAECAKKVDDYSITVSKNGLSYGDDMLAASTTQSTHNSWKKVLETILVSGCSNICAEVSDQKMGQAYRCATGNKEYHENEDTGELEADDPNYIESPYSYNSYTDFYGNIVSIRNSLYGNLRGSTYNANSIMAYLMIYNAEMARILDADINAALAALVKCQQSGQSFRQNPGAACVKEAMDVITALDNYLNQVSGWILSN